MIKNDHCQRPRLVLIRRRWQLVTLELLRACLVSSRVLASERLNVALLHRGSTLPAVFEGQIPRFSKYSYQIEPSDRSSAYVRPPKRSGPHSSCAATAGRRELCLYDPRTDSANSPYNRLFMGGRPNRLLKRGMMSKQKVRPVEDRNTTFRIHPLQTGRVQIKSAQLRRRRGGPARVLLDHAWTGWLPIHAW